MANDKTAEIQQRFDTIEGFLRPRFKMEPEFLNLTEQFMGLEQGFGHPDLAAYSYEIFPELEHNEQERRIFHVCLRQIQLMENVYIGLQMDSLKNRKHYLNRGWMNLFRRWAQSTHFRKAWCIASGIYSEGFQQFCEEGLKLRLEILWRLATATELTNRESHYQQKPLPPGTEAYIAEMGFDIIPGPDGFGEPGGTPYRLPVAFALLSKSTDHCDLLFYRIRDYYRKMHLLERMVDALRAHFSTMRLRVIFSTPQQKTDYAYFFERRGFEARVQEKPEQ